VASGSPSTGANVPKPPTDSELRLLVPAGFRLAMQLQYDFEGRGYPQFLLALADGNSEAPQKPIELLYVGWEGKWVIRDRRPIQSQGTGEYAKFWSPNYVNTLRLETIGHRQLVYVYSNSCWGGSGSNHLYSFYSVRDGRLTLLKQFEHERMMRFYFCLRNGAIYDAVLVKNRGAKHGNAYVYTCYLAVTKYSCDGNSIVMVGSEKLREMTGNRFLDEKYWNMSVCNALTRCEAFQSDCRNKQ
jgi:hypothetical protein